MNVIMKGKEWLNKGNNSLWVATAAMIVIGTIAIYQLAPFQDVRIGLPQGFLFGRYLPYLIFGIIMMIGCSRMSKKFMIRFSYVLMAFGMLLLGISLIQPHFVMGTTRYVVFCGMNLDPYMLMLPAYIVLMSNWLGKEITKDKKFWVWLACSVLTAIIVFMAINAPYMLMAGTYVLTFMVLTLQARKNMPAAFYTSLALGAAIFAAFAYGVLTMPHVHARLESMLYGTSYTVQATKAVIHSSSLIGSNPESIQALTNLPDVPTDFMFAGIVGKMGYLMGALVLMLYIWASISIHRTTQNASQFRKLLGAGVITVFILGFFGNIDTSIGGLQHASYLPFMSCSWNALLSFCLMFGFVLAKPEKK